MRNVGCEGMWSRLTSEHGLLCPGWHPTLLSLASGPGSYVDADAVERLKKAQATSAPQA